jgi:hypothetical protein
MEDDYVGPLLREKELKSKARARTSAARRKREKLDEWRFSWPYYSWRETGKGNWFLKVDDFKLTVFQTKFGTWKIIVSRGEWKKFGDRFHRSADEAKQAALKAIEWAADQKETAS